MLRSSAGHGPKVDEVTLFVVRTEADVEVESYRQDDMYPQQELTEIWISIYYRLKVVLHIAA
jgi:hypothetical protein